MTVRSGYFNSSNGDRVYDADDFAGFYDGLIIDGVYSTVGNRFYVSAKTGMYVTIDTGRAWFDHTWTYNDQLLTLMVEPANTVYDRIDAVVIEVNKEQRQNYIKIVQGTPAQTPVRPTLSKTDKVIQYALAYIQVKVNVVSITKNDITNVVGENETPLVTTLNMNNLPVMQYSTTDIEAGTTPLYTGTLYLVYE